VQTLKREYRQFISSNFNDLKFGTRSLYSRELLLRFDLQEGNTNTDAYFHEVNRCVNELFESCFSASDEVFIEYSDITSNRRKIRFSNFLFKQVEDLTCSDVHFYKEKRQLEPFAPFDKTNIAIIKTTSAKTNHTKILQAISHIDFPRRQPQLSRTRRFSHKEVHFININRKLIFHMYDDRGVDIIAADKKYLQTIYRNHHEWISEYVKEKTELLFKEQ
jgi:Domain of unknown function (DUF3885)